MARRLLGSATTNSSGVASLSYSSLGVGELDVIAVSTVDGVTVSSEPSVLWDTIWYDIATQNNHRDDYTNGGLTVSYEPDGTVLENTSTTGYNYSLNISINQDMVIEADITPLTSGGTFRFYICGGDGYVTSYFPTVDTTYHMKWICEDGTAKLFVDGTDTTYTRSMTSNTNIRFNIANKKIKFSNLVIYNL